MEEIDCKTCNKTCLESPCFCDNGTLCYNSSLGKPDEVTYSRLASLEMTWIFGAAVGLLLLTLLVAVLIQTWRKRQQFETKAKDDGGMYKSVVYVAPNTLKNRGLPQDEYRDGDFYEEIPQKELDEYTERMEQFTQIKEEY